VFPCKIRKLAHVEEPRLTGITLVMAIAFLFAGLSVEHQALLTRQMRFKDLAVVDLTSMFVGVTTTIVNARYGAGYWALALMQVAMAIAYPVGVWTMCSWRPSIPVRGSGVRSILAFGGNLTGFSVFNYFARNLDNILIGRVWGAGALGIYSKAYSLMMLPLQQINGPITDYIYVKLYYHPKSINRLLLNIYQKTYINGNFREISILRGKYLTFL